MCCGEAQPGARMNLHLCSASRGLRARRTRQGDWPCLRLVCSRKGYLSLPRSERPCCLQHDFTVRIYHLLLFHCHRLREVARLIDVRAAQNGAVICEELQRNRVHGGRLEMAHMLRHGDDSDAFRRLNARIRIGETYSSPPRARTSCRFDFSFSSRSLFGATVMTGISSSRARADHASTRRRDTPRREYRKSP